MYNLAGKYAFCLGTDPQVEQQAFLLLHELETYVNGAIIQTNRLIRTRKSIDDEIKIPRSRNKPRISSKKDFRLIRLHLDYHFYFVCIGQIHKLLKSLGETLNDKDLRNVLIKFGKKFPEEIRHDLEHIDERAKGRKRREYIGHIADFGNFVGDSFSFGGRKYTVNKESLKELKLIYEEIIDIIYRNYASKDPDFIWREQSEIQIKRIQRYIKKWRLT